MACLMPPSVSCAKRRAGTVMSAIKPQHNTATLVEINRNEQDYSAAARKESRK
jgi:hypothetical protein